jgi:tRNA U34 2-thiouridine synthase MnmA/TrmU
MEDRARTEGTVMAHRKAVALISGGLDSLLAAKVMAEQGIGIIGVSFVMQFASRDLCKFKDRVLEATREAGLSVRFEEISEEFLEMLRSPDHGYGANINPCIDCKILMLKKAKGIMGAEGADFVVTGEVLGERPMSQRKAALDIIEKGSSLYGLLLRPLSAKLLPTTVPERTGLVDRDRLFDIQGRSRERQLELARHYGLTKYFSPAGGCLLTDPIFARKLKDLLDGGALSAEDVTLLKHGRHFRLDVKTKAVVGRNEDDNGNILAVKNGSDMVMRLKDKAGPYALLRGDTSADNIRSAAMLVVSHSKSRGERTAEVEFWKEESDKRTVTVQPMPPENIERIRV